MKDRRWVVVAVVFALLVAGLAAFYLVQRHQIEHLMLTKIPTRMRAIEVRQVLGSPAEIETTGHFTIGGKPGRCREFPAQERWIYGKSSFYRVIDFDSTGKVVCDEWLIIQV